MTVFTNPNFSNHERVVFGTDEKTGLRAIIAVHNTNRGPGLGGTRMKTYASDDEAISDALRLSRGMTYKNAMANLPLGGGKAIIIGDPKTQKTRELLLAYGKFVDSLGGMYLTAEDVGMTVKDMDIIREVTQYAHGVPDEAGDPSPATAYGTYLGIKAAVKHKKGLDSLKGLKIAVEGVGSVGMKLCEYLHKDGVDLIISDINEEVLKEAKKRFGATGMKIGGAHLPKCDVYAPCALGATLNPNTIPFMGADIVAGCANNQLFTDKQGQELKDAGILYVPDYVINAGGVIDTCHECTDGAYDKVMEEVALIYDRVLRILKQADKENLPTNVIADRIAKKLFEQKQE